MHTSNDNDDDDDDDNNNNINNKAHAVEITELVEYVEKKEDPLIQVVRTHQHNTDSAVLTLRLLMSYIYGAPSKARNANVVYIWTYVWKR